MISLKFPINLLAEDSDFIESVQKEQSPMTRSAYKFASDGLAEISVRSGMRERFPGKLDSWYQQSSVKLGIGMFKSDNELGVDKRIFGGKSNIIRRSKGLISNEEWKQCRLMPVYLIGESPAKGNRKFDFYDDRVIFKPFKGKKIEIKLPKMRKNWSKLWKQAVLLANEKLLPITVSLTKDHIVFSFDDKKVKQDSNNYKNPIGTRYAGIDLNPNYVGVSIFDRGKLVDTKIFSFKKTTGKYACDDKLEHETIEVAHSIGKWLKHNQVAHLYLEQLSFKQGDKKQGKAFNRLTQNQWKKTAFKDALRKYYDFSEVNAAYSSTIGNLLNSLYPDPIAASMEIARRGYECFKKKSKKFYPDLISQRELQNRWKEIEFPMFKSWKELHDFLRNAKLKYRVPLPPEESFRIFSSSKSFIGVI